MKHITEKFHDSRSIADMIEESNVNEGLKDIFKKAKDLFKKAWQYLKGVVVNVGNYFLPVNENGDVEPAITPMTAGVANKRGATGPNTLVCLASAEAKIAGVKNSASKALDFYKGGSIAYWDSLLNENQFSDEVVINEAKIQNDDAEAKYNVIVDNKELIQEIQWAIEDGGLARLMIWGAPGIGKTAIIESVIAAQKKINANYNSIIITLSDKNPDDFSLPAYEEIDGQKKATDIPKTWLPVYRPTGDPKKDAELDEKCGKGLLFIDELSRATKQVRNVILPLINEGRLNMDKIGSGWTIVCASNRPGDDDDQDLIGSALSNRFQHVYYEPTVHTWKEWANTQGFISPLLTQWLSMPESENMSGAKFFYMDPNDSFDGDQYTALICTPRAWTNAMRILCRMANVGDLEGFKIVDIPRRIVARALNKCVPASAVDSFLAFLDVIEKIGDFDAAVYDVWKNSGKTFKVDKKNLNLIAVPIAQLICTAHAHSLPTKEEFESLAEWLVSQSNDQLASYVLDVFKNVFMGMVNDTEDAPRDLLFILAKKMSMDSQYKSAYERAFSSFFNHWGISIDDMPDYSVGLKAISKKYKDAFKSANINGVEMLG